MAAGNTYTPLATQTLGSAAASVTFSSISGAYTDLVLVMGLGTDAGRNVTVELNSDTGTNYSRTTIYGDGSVAGSSRTSNANSYRIDDNSFAGTTTNGSPFFVHFMNYSNTTTFKTMLGRANNASVGTSVSVGLWRSTSAITTIKISALAGTFNSGTTFTLYGIAAA